MSTDTEFFEVMVGETGAPVTRAFGPRQSVDTVAAAIARAIERPVAEVYPHACVARSGDLNARGAGSLRPVRPAVRPQSRSR